jgi:hypothetical protein
MKQATIERHPARRGRSDHRPRVIRDSGLRGASTADRERVAATPLAISRSCWVHVTRSWRVGESPALAHRGATLSQLRRRGLYAGGRTSRQYSDTSHSPNANSPCKGARRH